MSGQQPLQLWGGLECTVVQIGNGFRNQIEETGHLHRLADLDAVAALGIRTLRYPVVWEMIAPEHPDRCDWRWTDERFGRLRELGMSPIPGLVHHGSGPRYTSLVDPQFPELLARHAERVATRYPWLEMFTPINEPLTTARFSGLYGHWHPHRRDYPTFLRALVVECRATVLAMRAIRRITPGARLVQTEDLGKVFGTPHLRYQVDHENERRWLSLDLLCGRVDRAHPWHAIFVRNGVAEDELAFFLDGDGAPDIIGINHYATSDRYLDEDMDRYPASFHGGNHLTPRNGATRIDRYADVEALRMDLPEEDLGPKARLAEAWERYGRPIAVTEAHHGSTREEQVRWLMEVVARACSRLGLPMAAFSSDRVFDGRLGRAYVESDATGPTCVYGESKVEAERRIAQAHPDALVIRTSAFFGPWDDANFVHRVLADLEAGRTIKPASGIVSPTYVPDLVDAVLDLLVDHERGVWHLANDGMVSWSELAERVAAQAGLSWRPRHRLVGEDVPLTALASERGQIMPRLDDALARYFQEREVIPRAFLDAAE